MIGSIARSFAANRRRAQGMTEYIIIVALVAVALITIVTMFGNKIKFLFTGSVKSLDEGKVTNPAQVQGNQDLQDKLGQDQTDLDAQKQGHSLKQFKSGQ